MSQEENDVIKRIYNAKLLKEAEFMENLFRKISYFLDESGKSYNSDNIKRGDRFKSMAIELLNLIFNPSQSQK